MVEARPDKYANHEYRLAHIHEYLTEIITALNTWAFSIGHIQVDGDNAEHKPFVGRVEFHHSTAIARS